MSISRSFFVAMALFSGTVPVTLAADKPSDADVSSPEKRKTALALARRLESPEAVEPLPADLPLPFGPPGFEQTDAEERAAAMAAAMRNNQSSHVVSERETLEAVCSRLSPTGTIFSGDEPRLLFGPQIVKTGAHFIIKGTNGENYDLELVSIDRTTFTVRHNGEEVTRPISAKPSAPGKSK